MRRADLQVRQDTAGPKACTTYAIAGSLHSAHQRVKRSPKRSTRGLRFDCSALKLVAPRLRVRLISVFALSALNTSAMTLSEPRPNRMFFDTLRSRSQR